MCQHSKWQAIEKQKPSTWFMACVQKRDCSCSLFNSYLIFCIPVLYPLRTSDESRPTCLDHCCLPLSYLLVPVIFTPWWFIIRGPETLQLLQFDLCFSMFLLWGCDWGLPTLKSLFFLFLSGVSGQRVKVDQEVSSYPGQSVTLRCNFADATDVQLTMVRKTKWY